MKDVPRNRLQRVSCHVSAPAQPQRYRHAPPCSPSSPVATTTAVAADGAAVCCLTLRPQQLSPSSLMLGGGMSSIVSVSDAEAADIVHACLRAGIRDYDNAPLYGSGVSEEKLGKALLSATAESCGAEVSLDAATRELVVGGTPVRLYTKTGRLVRQLQEPPASPGELQWRPSIAEAETSSSMPQHNRVITNDYSANGAFLSFSESQHRLGGGRLAIDTLRIHDADSNGGWTPPDQLGRQLQL